MIATTENIASAPPAVRHCVDCRHCIPSKHGAENSLCGASDEGTENTDYLNWLVAGGKEPARHKFCKVARLDGGFCGVDARHFTPKT